MAEGRHEGKSAQGSLASSWGSGHESRRQVTPKINTDNAGDG